MAQRTFGQENKAVNFVVSSLNTASSTLDVVSNVFHYSSVFSKTSKYIRAGTFATKVHKIGQGLTGAVLTGFDLFEFIAKDQTEAGPFKLF